MTRSQTFGDSDRSMLASRTISERIQAGVGRRPAAPSTYQARPKHVASDSRLSPVRGSAQPAPPLASGFFLPSLRFSGSPAAPLGPGFFRLFTSDMSGTLKTSNPGWPHRGYCGTWLQLAFRSHAPSQTWLRPQDNPAPRLAPPPASGFRYQTE